LFPKSYGRREIELEIVHASEAFVRFPGRRLGVGRFEDLAPEPGIPGAQRRPPRFQPPRHPTIIALVRERRGREVAVLAECRDASSGAEG
jgi:hypothetical protein